MKRCIALFIMCLMSVTCYGATPVCKACKSKIGLHKTSSGNYACWQHFCRTHQSGFKTKCNKCSMQQEIDKTRRLEAEKRAREEKEAEIARRKLEEERRLEAERTAKEAEIARRQEEARREKEELDMMNQTISALVLCEEYFDNLIQAFKHPSYCPIHKWREEFAPRFGSDFNTEQSKNEYARNLMLAMSTPNLKCSCSLDKYSSYKTRMHDAENKLKSKGIRVSSVDKIYNDLEKILDAVRNKKIVIENDVLAKLKYLEDIMPTDTFYFHTWIAIQRREKENYLNTNQ